MIILCGFGVSNYYNKLKLVMLEKRIPFSERLVYPWERENFADSSPLGKIPFVETDEGPLSESQVILDYLEDRFPESPLYPSSVYSRARCRELIQYLELNAEWVARRLYREAFFGGTVSVETKFEVRERLEIGLLAIARMAKFAPFMLGQAYTAADCVAYVHFTMISAATAQIFGEDLVERLIPQSAVYMQLIGSREHSLRVMSERTAALACFKALNVPYNG